jgi:hypothetical protein
MENWRACTVRSALEDVVARLRNIARWYTNELFGDEVVCFVVYGVGMVVDWLPEVYARVLEDILHELLALND